MSTYFVYDHHDEKDEMRRLTIQDQMITSAMGGVLSEQADPSVFHHILDIGCGTGGWMIEAAKRYPEMMLTGIDVNNNMKTLKPFIKKWGSTGQMYEEVCQMAREQINRPDFYAVWQLLTAWGKK